MQSRVRMKTVLVLVLELAFELALLLDQQCSGQRGRAKASDQCGARANLVGAIDRVVGNGANQSARIEVCFTVVVVVVVARVGARACIHVDRRRRIRRLAVQCTRPRVGIEQRVWRRLDANDAARARQQPRNVIIKSPTITRRLARVHGGTAVTRACVAVAVHYSSPHGVRAE